MPSIQYDFHSDYFCRQTFMIVVKSYDHSVGLGCYCNQMKDIDVRNDFNSNRIYDAVKILSVSENHAYSYQILQS